MNTTTEVQEIRTNISDAVRTALTLIHNNEEAFNIHGIDTETTKAVREQTAKFSQISELPADEQTLLAMTEFYAIGMCVAELEANYRAVSSLSSDRSLANLQTATRRALQSECGVRTSSVILAKLVKEDLQRALEMSLSV